MPSYLPVGSLGPAFHKGIAHVPVRDKGTGGDHRGNASFPMEDRRLRQASGGMGAGAAAAAGAPGRRHGIGRGRVLRWMGGATQCAADGARTRLHRSLLRFWAAGRRRWRQDANLRGRVATAAQCNRHVWLPGMRMPAAPRESGESAGIREEEGWPEGRWSHPAFLGRSQVRRGVHGRRCLAPPPWRPRPPRTSDAACGRCGRRARTQGPGPEGRPLVAPKRCHPLRGRAAG